MPATGTPKEDKEQESNPSAPSSTNSGGASAKQTLEVRGLPCFDPKGEPNSLSARWKRWKRAFNLHVASRGVTNEGQKVALLLHSGGIELQEIYYTLVSEDHDTSFNDCVAVLDNYFTPKVNVPFERHFLRQMQQMEGETIDQFVCRLRQKAISCEFPSVDEAIRDQIIEKCRDPKLRRKFLEKSSEATLTVLQETARVHEAVNTQMQSMERPEQVNKLSPNDRQAKEKGTKGKKCEKERKCYRNGCGGTGHLVQDKSCPALDKTCEKCGKSGHFAACCKTKSTKKPSGRHRSEGANKVSEEKEKEDNSAFVLDTKSSNGSSGVVDLCVGGAQLKNVLIDAGATCNIVDRATWDSLKQKGVKCKSRKCEKKLFAYGQTKSIEVVGTF